MSVLTTRMVDPRRSDAASWAGIGEGRIRSVLVSVDRWLGRRGTAIAVTILTGFATLVSGALSLGLYWTLYGLPPVGMFLVNPIISTIVAAPIIWYSQLIIRNLAQTKRELAALTGQLSTAYDLAESANRAKSAFLANMSHELRTPLNAIIGFSEILISDFARRGSDNKSSEYLEDIKASGVDLLEIINNVLDLAKIESGHTEMLDEMVEWAELLNEVERMVGPLASAQDIALSIERDAGDFKLRGNQRLIRQMLLNLLSNAMKFSPAGGLVSVRSVFTEKGGLNVAVSDSGIGMTPAEIVEALSRFGQVDKGLSRKFGGAGVGLPLTKAVMEQHGGAMSIDSKAGGGTRVTLHFPPERLMTL